MAISDKTEVVRISIDKTTITGIAVMIYKWSDATDSKSTELESESKLFLIKSSEIKSSWEIQTCYNIKRRLISKNI